MPRLPAVAASLPLRPAPGSPLYFSVPKLSGYDVEIGRNFGGKFNYSCAGSVFNTSCVLIGSSARVRGAGLRRAG